MLEDWKNALSGHAQFMFGSNFYYLEAFESERCGRDDNSRDLCLVKQEIEIRNS